MIETIWLSGLTILVLVALFRKRYTGDYIYQSNADIWDIQRALEDALDNPQFVKKLISSLNEYQLNRSGEMTIIGEG
jgi:hypothetical protein